MAFNEPGTPWSLGFHVAELAESTRSDLTAQFAPSPVPTRATTAGVASILAARRIVLVATGASKAPAVERLASGEATPDLPASCLRSHPNVLVIVDAEAGLSLRPDGW